MERSAEPRRRFRLAELNRDELQERLPEATVVIPIGATEQHGPHLPIMTDHLMAETIALRAAELVPATADVLVAPVLPYGCSQHHLAVGGALTVTQRTYIAFLVDLAESVARMGGKRLVLLNGHGGNEDSMRVVANELVFERRLDMAVAAVSYWTIGQEALAAFPHPGPATPATSRQAVSWRCARICHSSTGGSHRTASHARSPSAPRFAACRSATRASGRRARASRTLPTRRAPRSASERSRLSPVLRPTSWWPSTSARSQHRRLEPRAERIRGDAAPGILYTLAG